MRSELQRHIALGSAASFSKNKNCLLMNHWGLSVVKRLSLRSFISLGFFFFAQWSRSENLWQLPKGLKKKKSCVLKSKVTAVWVWLFLWCSCHLQLFEWLWNTALRSLRSHGPHLLFPAENGNLMVTEMRTWTTSSTVIGRQELWQNSCRDDSVMALCTELLPPALSLPSLPHVTCAAKHRHDQQVPVCSSSLILGC